MKVGLAASLATANNSVPSAIRCETDKLVPSFRLKEEAEKRRLLQVKVLEAELRASRARVKELERTFITRKKKLTLAR
jgi:hypothetical protein